MLTPTRQKILQAAHDLYLQQGYHATSMRQIARQAGIALSSIYNHFPSKEDLFVTLLDTHHPYQIILPTLLNSDTIHDLPGLLRAAAEHTRQALEEHPDFLNLMLIEMIEFNGKHMPAFHQAMLGPIDQLVQRFLDSVGDLRPIPIPVMVRAFIGLLVSYTITERFLGKNLPEAFSENFLEYLVDIFLYGILSRSH